MLLKIFLIFTPITFFAAPAAPAENLVEKALGDLKAGSVTELKRKIINRPITVLGAQYRQNAIASLPEHVRQNRVNSSNLHRRLEQVMASVLELHHQTENLELYLYHSEQPLAFVWRGCILAISDSLALFLNNDELAGVIAHEVGHAYFTDESLAAKRSGKAFVMRAVELKCDAVALLTLKLMGRDPTSYINGLWKLTSRLTYGGYEANSWWHPRMAERDRFARLFIRLLNG